MPKCIRFFWVSQTECRLACGNPTKLSGCVHPLMKPPKTKFEGNPTSRFGPRFFCSWCFLVDTVRAGISHWGLLCTTLLVHQKVMKILAVQKNDPRQSCSEFYVLSGGFCLFLSQINIFTSKFAIGLRSIFA